VTAKQTGKATKKPAKQTGKPKNKPAKAEKPTGHQRAKNAPRKGEELYRTLVESALDGIVIHVGDRVAFANRAAAALLGFAGPAALVGRPLASFVHPDDLANAAERVRKVLAGEAVAYPVEVRYVKRGGTGFPVENTAALVSYKGKPALLSVIRDITERKRAEEALKNSLSLVEATLETTDNGILVVNPEGAVVKANRRFAEMWRIPDDILASGDDERLLNHVLSQLSDPDAFVAKVKALYGDPVAETADLLYFKDGRVFERTSKPMLVGGEPTARVWSFLDVTDRKRAEEALRKSEEEYRGLTEHINLGIYRNTVGPEGKFVEANPAIIGMFGYGSKAGFLSINVSDLYQNPQDRNAFNDKMLKEGFVRGEELWLKKKDGSLFVGSVSAVAVNDEQGQVEYYDGIIDDITERKRTEEALRASEERFRTLYEDSTIGIYRTTPDGRIQLANPALIRMLGYSSFDDLSTRSLEEEDYEPSYSRRQFVDSIERDGEVKGLESAWKRKDGTIFFARESARACRDAHGNTLYYDGTVEDITERKRAEEALAQERFLLQAFMNNVPDHVYFKDRDSRLIRINKAQAQAFGMSDPAQAIGKTDFDFFTEQHARQAREDELAIMRTGQPANKEERETWAGRPDTWVSTTKAPLRDEEGNVVGTFGISRDITERKQAETYRETRSEVLQILNEPGPLRGSIQRVLGAVKAWTGVDAVGMRLKDGDDFPYFVEEGFSRDFLLTENTLIERDADGGVCRDRDGNVSLECTCGLVISGKTDPANPYFAQGGSCWTNDDAGTPFQDTRLHPRDRCLHDGFQSVALVPIRTKDQIVGLLQLNDRRKGRFSLAAIEQLEGLAAHVGEALMRKRVEEALRESEERHRHLVESSDDWIWESDANGFITFSSAKVMDLLGYTPEEVVGMTAYDLLPPDDAAKTRATGGPKIAQGKAFRGIENTNLHKNGRLVVLESTGVPVFDASGAFRGCRGMDRDITDRKRVEESLRESEARYRRITEGLTDYQYTVRVADGRAVETRQGPACARVTGYTAEEYAADPYLWIQMVTPEDRDRVREHARRILAGEDVPVIEHHIVRKDGAVRWVGDTAILLKDASGRLLSYDGVISDITDRKRAEEDIRRKAKDLQEKNEELTRFTYAVSHDLRSPLVTIQTFQGYLEQDVRSQDAARIEKDLRYIRNAADKMGLLLDELLRLSRVGRVTNPPEEAPLQSLVKEALDLVAGRLTARGVKVVVTEEPVMLTGDRTRLVEVFQNLVDNATKFMGDEPAPRVEIGVEQAGEELVLFVRDNGIGIEPQLQPLVFDLFRKLDPGTDGVGIGLALVRRIVELHGGRIWVESEGLGKGTTFRLTLAQTTRKRD